ncbi:MAG: oxygen-independent coproporphyrinogen III oxidase [Deltaproteobacteria bacterium]|nr:oxygen-independent coproporphyrinogen III oxidase [Deltaproteobacteria bacterium]
MDSHAASQALVAKYDRPGPRYTSYPAVPAWQETFDHKAYETRLNAHAVSPAPAPLSLYVHLPFCRKRCLYCGCNVVISNKQDIVLPYLDALLQEIRMVADRLGTARHAMQLHFGGGTPTFLTPAQLQHLVGALEASFDFVAGAERSVEVDPRVTTAEHLATLRALGFDRISMGVQDLDDEVQVAIGRVQPAEQTQRFFEDCRAAGFASINVDLIYGLPQQTPASFDATIATVGAWQPDRIALFSYAHVPHMRPHQAKMPVGLLPSARTKLGLYVNAVEAFERAGYTWIGLDHFAKPTDELATAHAQHTLRRNFMGFTTKPETDVVAFGLSAISEVNHAYAQNDPHLPGYRRRIESGTLATTRGVELTRDDQIRRDVIMSLLCTNQVSAEAIERKHHISFAEYFAAEHQALDALMGDGLLTASAAGIQVTRKGRWVLRNICMVFDAHLAPTAQRARGAQPQYSRTI